MHELGVIQNVVAIVAEHADGRKVKRVALEIGKLSGVVIEPLRFCFDLATEGTTLEGALLEIREVDGRATCADCGEEFAQETLYASCPCGGREWTRVSGEELRVKEYELA